MSVRTVARALASDTIHMSAKIAILLSCILYFFYDKFNFGFLAGEKRDLHVLPAIYGIFCKSVCNSILLYK